MFQQSIFQKNEAIIKGLLWEFIYYQEMSLYIQQEDWLKRLLIKVKVEVIDYLKCTIEIMKGELFINYKGKVLPTPDAIIP